MSFDNKSFLNSLNEKNNVKKTYTFRRLTIDEISKMGEFSLDEIYKKLPENEKTFIYPRRAVDFYEAIGEGDIFIWIFDKDKLIGLSSLHDMGNNEALFCADSVSQLYRNKWLNSKMIEIRTDLAKILWYTTVKADIDVDNYKNVRPYLKNGFIITATEKDETDGWTVYKLEKKLEKTENNKNIHTKEILFTNHKNIENLLKKWYIWTGIKTWQQELFLILTKAA